MKTKEYWDKTFENRFERQKMDPERPPLKVSLVYKYGLYLFIPKLYNSKI